MDDEEKEDLAIEPIDFEDEEVEISDNLKKLIPEQRGRRPDYRVSQLVIDKEGKTKFVEIGAMWSQESTKTGESFYILRIGRLKLFVFKNNKGETDERS